MISSVCKMLLAAAAAVLLLVGSTHAARNVFGSCPAVKPMADFDMSKFEGLWYVAECFDTVTCMTWNITKLSDTKWHLTETKTSGMTKVYNAKLILNPATPGALTINWAINLGGRYPFTVHDTDYTTYASVFLCQKVVFYTRQNGITLSRTPLMPIGLRQVTSGKLATYDVEMSYFRKVDQGHCGYSTNDDDMIDMGIGVNPNEFLGDFGGDDLFAGDDGRRIN